MRSDWPNLWHLQVFLTVAETHNLSTAAAKLLLTQPAVSQALAGLEAHYACDLARRVAGRVALTGAGEILAMRAARTLALLSDGLREAIGAPSSKTIQLVRAISSARLEALTAVVRHQSFTAASRALDVAAPTLHRAARDLEKSLGIVLFEATSFGVRPSRQAEIVARAASLAFAELRQAAAEIDAFMGRETGRTVIGAMPLARSQLVPVSVEIFSRRHANHRITIAEGAYDDLLVGLRRGDIDFLVGAERADLSVKGVAQEALFSDELAIVMRAGHPLINVKRISIATLKQYPWIAPRAESPLRQHFEQLFAPKSPPGNIIECNALGASRVMLMNSDRLALLSDAQIQFEKSMGALESRPPPGGARKRSIALTRRSSWRPTKTQEQLLALLKENARMI
ncbi:MAG: LysR family transcriptional regulator [Pseudomonadota bacterium]